MTDVLIKRELLERELLSVLDFSESNLRRVVDHLLDAGYTRAAPRQPEGEGLEVVAHLLIDDPMDGESGDWDIDVVGSVADRIALEGGQSSPLCRLSDAQRAIAEWQQRCQYNADTAHDVAAERDTLRQQRDKLAGLLREVRVIVAREVERWTRAAAILPVNANVESGLLTRIDAALAEVKPCQESPQPAAT